MRRSGRPSDILIRGSIMLCRCDALFAAVFAVVLLSAPVVNAESDEALMKAGLEALYTARDPEAAATQFRKVLEQNPNHYGATFQLAMALDRGGKPAEALPLWEKVLKMAEGYSDKATAGAAGTQLETDRQTVMMIAGLEALYGRRDPEAAAVEFRTVLERNPTHFFWNLKLS